VFVPRCCAPLANIRRYEPDGSGTIIAERANEFWRGGQAASQVFTEFGGVDPINRHPQISSKVVGDFLYVYYNRLRRSADGLLTQTVAPTNNVAVMRYPLDLSDEMVFEYSQTQGITVGIGSPEIIERPLAGFGVDNDGNVSAIIYTHIAAVGLGGLVPTIKVRSWDASGNVRWTIDSPQLPSTGGNIESIQVLPDGRVWLVWSQVVAGTITPEDPFPNPVVEVYADLRAKATGALIFRQSLLDLSKTIWGGAAAPESYYRLGNQFTSGLMGNGNLVVVAREFVWGINNFGQTDDTEQGPRHHRAAVVRLDNTGYAWWRLRRPATGATSSFSGFAAQTGEDMYPECAGRFGVGQTYATKAGMVFTSQDSVWLLVNLTGNAGFVSSQWWNYTPSGAYLREMPTQVYTATSFDQHFSTPENATNIFFAQSPITTQVDVDAQGNWHLVRQLDDGPLPGGTLLEPNWQRRIHGRVSSVRDNLTINWASPTYTTTTNPYGAGQIAECPGGMMSIACEFDLRKPSGYIGSYFLVGVCAF
jgi:hypothetical protein